MKGAIFLSASVPLPGRGHYHETADPFLIQFAVRELLTVVLGRRTLIWGGHPAITPMVSAVCDDLGVQYTSSVILYQSDYFRTVMPPENDRFTNLVRVPPVPGDLDASLLAMRMEMLSHSFDAAVFIGGMEGVFEEYALFTMLHPNATVVLIPSAGGAARELAQDLDDRSDRIDFARLFYERLTVKADEPRRSRL
jgi:hypothetical protein